MNERTSDEADFQPTRHDTFALIGTLLLLTQDTEEKIALALRVVFKNGIITAEDFVRKDKKTLGQLVREIRRKMHVDGSFEGLLLAFVEQRNCCDGSTARVSRRGHWTPSALRNFGSSLPRMPRGFGNVR